MKSTYDVIAIGEYEEIRDWFDKNIGPFVYERPEIECYARNWYLGRINSKDKKTRYLIKLENCDEKILSYIKLVWS